MPPRWPIPPIPRLPTRLCVDADGGVFGRHCLRRRCVASARPAAVRAARFSSSIRIRSSSNMVAAAPPPFPTVESCPSPSCACAATPEMPEGFEIDRQAPLNGLISNYHQHVLVCTGKDDWPSRIEEDNSGDNLAADLRELFGRGGRFSDPFHNVSVLNTSFPSSVPRRTELHTSSAYLLPSFKYVPFLPRVSFDHVEALAKGYLLPETLHPHHGATSPLHRDALTRRPEYRGLLYGVRDVADVLVLVCGHGGRDARCGVYGPLLRAEFERLLPVLGVDVLSGPVLDETDAPAIAAGSDSGTPNDGVVDGGGRQRSGGRQRRPTSRVAVVSHIGGHKFAGNVIVYLPPELRDERDQPHPLAGHGIWYGRVEPRHVEGVIIETIGKGNVIKELFRGGITPKSEIVRL